MLDQFTLEEIDRDGAIGEAAFNTAGDTRLDFLKKSALGVGTIAGGGAILSALAPAAAMAGGAPPKAFGKGDIAILNYALTLEFLEADFYAKVIGSGLLKGAEQDFAKRVGDTEQQHVDAIKATIEKLGGTAVTAPKTKFPLESRLAVLKLAATVENLGAAAYLGKAGEISNPEVLAAALSIHSVEARHAAALNQLLGKNPLPDGAFAKPAKEADVLAAVKPFLVA